MVRPYLTNQYGVKDSDIGWKPQPGGGNMVTVGGYDFMGIAPENLRENPSYATTADFDKAMEAFRGKTGYDFAASSDPATRNYTPGNTDQINALLDEILKYPEFQYDRESDPVYQSLMESAEKSGKTAYTNSLAELSSMTGGRPNSWAASVAGSSQRAILDQANAQVPNLYMSAYDRWRQGKADKVSDIGLLTGLDDRDYGRFLDERNYDYGVGRDERADMVSDRSFDEGVRQFDTTFDRGVLESDRGFDEDVRRYDQNFGRGVLESDRSFNRGVLESDRGFGEDVRRYDQNFGRGVLESDRDYDLKKDEYDYRKQQDEKTAEEQAPPTAGQLSNYNQIRDGLLNSQSSPAEALAYVNRMGKEFYTDLIGETLYSQLLSDLHGGYQQAEPETLGAIYEAMMLSPDPEEWLKSNAVYMTGDEVKQAVKWLPKEQQVELLRQILGG
jgi:hypothetical protein